MTSAIFLPDHFETTQDLAFFISEQFQKSFKNFQGGKTELGQDRQPIVIQIVNQVPGFYSQIKENGTMGKQTAQINIHQLSSLQDDHDLEQANHKRYSYVKQLSKTQEKQLDKNIHEALQGQPSDQSVRCTVQDCGRKLSNRLCLRRHIMAHHMGLKKFVCNICGREFAQSQYLKEHINAHTNTFPYVCDVEGCNQKFKQRSRLCLHKKDKHNNRKRTLNLSKDFEVNEASTNVPANVPKNLELEIEPTRPQFDFSYSLKIQDAHFQKELIRGCENQLNNIQHQQVILFNSKIQK